jgi:hypothetical protein
MNIWSRNHWKKQLISNFSENFWKRKRSRSKICGIEKNYNDLKKLGFKAKEKPIVWNEMYGDVWYLPEEKLLWLILFPMPMRIYSERQYRRKSSNHEL